MSSEERLRRCRMQMKKTDHDHVHDHVHVNVDVDVVVHVLVVGCLRLFEGEGSSVLETRAEGPVLRLCRAFGPGLPHAVAVRAKCLSSSIGRQRTARFVRAERACRYRMQMKKPLTTTCTITCTCSSSALRNPGLRTLSADGPNRLRLSSEVT